MAYMESVVFGVVTRAGTPVPSTLVDTKAYVGVCGSELLFMTSQLTDAGGRFRYDIPGVSADSLCLAVSATPPAGSGLDSWMRSGVVVRKSAPGGPLAFDTVRVDFAYP